MYSAFSKKETLFKGGYYSKGDIIRRETLFKEIRYFKIAFLVYVQPQKAKILSNHSYTTLDYNYGVEISGL